MLTNRIRRTKTEIRCSYAHAVQASTDTVMRKEKSRKKRPCVIGHKRPSYVDKGDYHEKDHRHTIAVRRVPAVRGRVRRRLRRQAARLPPEPAAHHPQDHPPRAAPVQGGAVGGGRCRDAARCVRDACREACRGGSRTDAKEA